jgi:hypothetical protein
MPAVFVGGLVFGVGLALSGMARPEVVLDFLQFEDFGLVLVMAGGAATTGVVVGVASYRGGEAPLTGRSYGRRLKSLDRSVLVGGAVFGAGWGLSGICPGAAYASLGVGNLPILWALAGMFLGAYAQGYWREAAETPTGGPEVADD